MRIVHREYSTYEGSRFEYRASNLYTCIKLKTLHICLEYSVSSIV